MKNHQNESSVSAPRRRLFGAVAGAVAGIVGWKAGGRKESLAMPLGTDSSVAASNGAKPAPSTGPIVVQPAPHAVKRHG